MKGRELKAPAATAIRITEDSVIADFPREFRLEFIPSLMAPHGRALPASPLHASKGVLFDHLDTLTLWQADRPVIQLVCWPDWLITVLNPGYRQSDLREYWTQAAILYGAGRSEEPGRHLIYSVIHAEEPLKNALWQERLPVADGARVSRVQRAMQAITSAVRK